MYLIISDTHIGDKRTDQQLDVLIGVLNDYAGEDSHLVLNGDIFDLSRNMSLDSRHRMFIKTARTFKSITYVEGNHDLLISGLGDAFGPKFQCVKSLRIMLGERSFNILHGHQADIIARSWFGRFVVKLNKWAENLVGIDIQRSLQKTNLSKWFHRRQEKRLEKMESWGDVIVAGHTHIPRTRIFGKRSYVNTGDWMVRDECHYVVIEDNGDFRLVSAY